MIASASNNKPKKVTKKLAPCPAGIEDACPIPRDYCKSKGKPGKHCEELFTEFEAFVFPSKENDASSAGLFQIGGTGTVEDWKDALGDMADTILGMELDEEDSI